MIKSEWEKMGQENPYYLVITLDKYEGKNLSDDLLEDFLRTGYDHIERIWTEIEEHFEADFTPENALDFGCGVGRLAIPLAKKANHVTGIDIAENLLEEASENSRRYNLSNTEFVQTDDFFAKNKKKFDLIHSVIVLQHIKPSAGIKIFEKLVDVLDEDGIGVIQMTYEDPAPKFSAMRFKIYRDFPLVYKLRNLIKRSDKPLFPMYDYNLNKIFSILQKNNCHKCFVNFSFHGRNGVVIFFQKKKGFIY